MWSKKKKRNELMARWSKEVLVVVLSKECEVEKKVLMARCSKEVLVVVWCKKYWK